jgi:hypothetical protein
MRGRIGRPARAALAATLALATMTGPAGIAGRSAGAAQEPDLTITAGSLALARQRSFFVVGGTMRKFTWSHRTKNVGSAPVRRSRTAVRFDLQGGISTDSPSLRVPRLAAGTAKAGGTTFTMDFRMPSIWAYGIHPTSICADVNQSVRESSEHNNCQDTRPLYLVPRSLEGTVRGSGWLNQQAFPGVTVKWKGTLFFELRHGADFANRGEFRYYWVVGRLTYTVGGTDDLGCTWSGTAVYRPPRHRIDRDYLMLRFGAFYQAFTVPPLVTSPWTATVTCPSGTHTAGFFAPGPWLLTGSSHALRKVGLPPYLRGSWTEQFGPSNPLNYFWRLVANPKEN